MSESSLKEKTAKGLLWGGFSNGLQQLLNLFFGIILARLLNASDYGMIGMLTIFSSLASTLQEGGFISALTNRKNYSHADYNAVFWFNISCGLIFYLILYFTAPYIADFYNEPKLLPLSRLTFLGFVIASTNIAPRAFMFKNMKTKQTTIISITSLLISGIVGVVLASLGFAYWGIAIQSLVFISSVSILNFYYSHWRPTLSFDFKPIKEMFGFSSKLIITNICNIINNNIFSVLLGKFYSGTEVGNFTQANKWNTMGYSFITGMIGGIAQPVFSSVNNDEDRQVLIFRKMLRFTAFISFPLMFGLSLVAKELIVITITSKWLASAEILQILAIGGAFIPIINLFSNLVISKGYSSLYMWNTITLGACQLFSVFVMYPYGLNAMLYTFISINIGWLLVWAYFTKRIIKLNILDALKDIFPYLLLSVVLIITTHFITINILNIYLSFVIKVIIVGCTYIAVLWKMNSTILKECINFITKKISK